ncbi:MAG: hypothetical protein P8N95_00380 [Paracoccaceae bacterium]|nr:hypothetical protein [Paracoccaceae bacterium]
MARKPRSSIIQTPRHAIFFFAMFILGAIVLSLAKIVNLPSGWEKVIIVSLSLILMITYAVFITLVPATRLRLDAAADNMYYLGFLYTLTSLAVALTVDDTDQILANFGVAISSTLIGIAARVGLNQLRVDPHDIEAASRLELSEATSRIRSEMDDAVLQLSSFRTMNLQVLTEGYEELQENIKRISDEMYSTLNEMIEKTSIPFNELAEKTSEANKKITSSLDELKSSNDDLVQSNRTAVTQIGRVNKALEGLQKHYSDTGIVDDKVIAAVQEQLLLLQNQLTKEAREEFEKLVSAVKSNSEFSSEIKSDLAKYFNNLVNPDEKPEGQSEKEEVTTSEIQEIFDQENSSKESNGERLKNAFAPSVENYKGEDILRYPNSKSYFWGDREFSTLKFTKDAIDAQLNTK